MKQIIRIVLLVMTVAGTAAPAFAKDQGTVDYINQRIPYCSGLYQILAGKLQQSGQMLDAVEGNAAYDKMLNFRVALSIAPPTNMEVAQQELGRLQRLMGESNESLKAQAGQQCDFDPFKALKEFTGGEIPGGSEIDLMKETLAAQENVSSSAQCAQLAAAAWASELNQESHETAFDRLDYFKSLALYYAALLGVPASEAKSVMELGATGKTVDPKSVAAFDALPEQQRMSALAMCDSMRQAKGLDGPFAARSQDHFKKLHGCFLSYEKRKISDAARAKLKSKEPPTETDVIAEEHQWPYKSVGMRFCYLAQLDEKHPGFCQPTAFTFAPASTVDDPALKASCDELVAKYQLR